MIRVDQRLLRRTLEEIFGMMGEKLIQWTCGGDHHSYSGFETTSRATRLLPGGSDSSGVADEDRRAQPTDVDSQFKRVRGNDGFDCSFTQSFFYFSSLGGEVTASITTDNRLKTR